MSTNSRTFARAPLSTPLAAIALMAACSSDGGQGSVELTTWGEEYIEQEIPASELEDGWTVRFDKFLVALSRVEIATEGGEVVASAPRSQLFDMTQRGPTLVARLDGIASGRYPAVSFVVAPVDATTALATATADDLARMRAGGFSVYVSGAAEKGAAIKRFSWGFSTATRYEQCRGVKDGVEVLGAVVTDGRTDAAEITIHGDHFFYDDLQAEQAKLRFDPLAAADRDDDGAITLEELAAVRLATLDPASGTYGTGALAEIADLRAFVTALSRTLAHFRGEGECVTRAP